MSTWRSCIIRLPSSLGAPSRFVVLLNGGGRRQDEMIRYQSGGISVRQ